MSGDLSPDLLDDGRSAVAPLTVWLLAHRLDAAGGTEELLTTLAEGLQRNGHRVQVLTRIPAEPGNRYGRRLRSSGAKSTSLPAAVAALAADWPTQDKLVLTLFRWTQWLLLPLALIGMLHPQLSFEASRERVLGRWRAMLSGWLHRDRLDQAFAALLTLRRLVDRPDIVQVFRYEMAPTVRWAVDHGLPTVYSEVTTPKEADPDLWRARGPQLDLADVVVTVSEASMTGLRRVAGLHAPITVIPPGLGLPAAVTPLQPHAGGEVRLAYIGRLSGEKGVDSLLRAMLEVRAVCPSVHLEVSGSGPLEVELQALSEDWGLAPVVRFSGAFDQESLPDLLARADIVVLPSLIEGMPFVLIEAMAHGRPVVATAVGGVPELVADGRTGILVPPSDPEALARALRELVDNPERRLAMGEAGRQRFLAGPHTETAFVSAHLDVYQAALASSGNRSRPGSAALPAAPSTPGNAD